jgi:peptide/nickel transport system substrate-binding protein
MKNKVVWGMLGVIIALSMVLTSCTQATTTPTVAPTTTTANWWDKFGEPQYGGTIIVRTFNINAGSFEPHGAMTGMLGAGGFATNIWLEGLTFNDWTLDRNIFPYKSGFTPLEYLKGLLAESWEWKDTQTIIVHLRQGVKWQDKPPVNGREFTSNDVVFNFDRVLGTGSGYTKPDPMISGEFTNIASIVAVDKYTVQFKLKQPGVMGIYQALSNTILFVPPEWVALGGPPSTAAAPPEGGPPGGGPPGGGVTGAGGPLTDWENVVGTGPWILTDFVAGSSMTFSRNPNYWGHDERYPQNKIPYADTLKELAIPDIATAMASLRTGKIDMMTDPLGALTWQQGATIAESNPEIQQSKLIMPGASIDLRCDTKPFTDIRVRKALQMAVDRQTIAKTYYGGLVDGKPIGMIYPGLKGWTTPYEEWPTELQQEYSYNPEKAKQLLNEAGYPNGFSTNVIALVNMDLELLQVLKSYFMDIGVDMEIRAMDPSAGGALVSAGKHDQMFYQDGQAGSPSSPIVSLVYRISASIPRANHTFNYDSGFDSLVSKLISATDLVEAKRFSDEADMYALQHHWTVTVCNRAAPIVWQPWIKGYSGEVLADISWAGACRARLWIDRDLKKSMGY